jgi:hypothetical protein
MCPSFNIDNSYCCCLMKTFPYHHHINVVCKTWYSSFVSQFIDLIQSRLKIGVANFLPKFIFSPTKYRFINLTNVHT